MTRGGGTTEVGGERTENVFGLDWTDSCLIPVDRSVHDQELAIPNALGSVDLGIRSIQW